MLGSLQHDRAASGLFHSLGRLGATLLAILQTRLQLLTTELQEEVRYAAGVLLWSFVAAFAAMLALFLGALAVIFAFWETHRMLAAFAMIALFGGVSLSAALVLAKRVRDKRPMLDDTLAELENDHEQLRTRR
ncbi:MAG: phage holin family protein [Proteobacteria bacterium]|nr:phage holin family protein [Pseudomonadota bacterium]